MSAIKNGQVSLYCLLNKSIKDPGISFQSPTLIPFSSIEHVRNVCHTTLAFDHISF